jgi:hypothetical protein
MSLFEFIRQCRVDDPIKYTFQLHKKMETDANRHFIKITVKFFLDYVVLFIV